jgi:hypothetical protein
MAVAEPRYTRAEWQQVQRAESRLYDTLRRRARRPADWELEAEAEFWRALASEAITFDSIAFASGMAAGVEQRLAERRERGYRRAPASLDVPALVQAVKAEADIVSVFAGRVPEAMRRASVCGSKRHVHVNCPFHADDTPSLVLYRDSDSWFCFGGCAIGGDVISFVKFFDRVEFMDALRALAAEHGVPIPSAQHLLRNSSVEVPEL